MSIFTLRVLFYTILLERELAILLNDEVKFMILMQQ